MIEANELQKCKNISDNLLEMIKSRINENCESYDEHNYLEDGFGFDYNDVSYDIIEIDSSNWDDQGKYQYKDTTYQLVSFDKNITCYPSEKSLIDKFNLFFDLSVIRCGSYFSDYYYQYEIPIIKIAEIKHIPEQIIPAHDVVAFVNLEGKDE